MVDSYRLFYIHQIFNHLGVVLFSIIFYAIEQYNIKTELKKSASDPSYKIKNKQRNNSNRIILIHNDEKKNINNKNCYFLFRVNFFVNNCRIVS